jgi:hypothetical protein
VPARAAEPNGNLSAVATQVAASAQVAQRTNAPGGPSPQTCARRRMTSSAPTQMKTAPRLPTRWALERSAWAPP